MKRTGRIHINLPLLTLLKCQSGDLNRPLKRGTSLLEGPLMGSVASLLSLCPDPLKPIPVLDSILLRSGYIGTVYPQFIKPTIKC